MDWSCVLYKSIPSRCFFDDRGKSECRVFYEIGSLPRRGLGVGRRLHMSTLKKTGLEPKSNIQLTVSENITLKKIKEVRRNGEAMIKWQFYSKKIRLYPIPQMPKLLPRIQELLLDAKQCQLCKRTCYQ